MKYHISTLTLWCVSLKRLQFNIQNSFFLTFHNCSAYISIYICTWIKICCKLTLVALFPSTAICDGRTAVWYLSFSDQKSFTSSLKSSNLFSDEFCRAVGLSWPDQQHLREVIITCKQNKEQLILRMTFNSIITELIIRYWTYSCCSVQRRSVTNQ